MKSVRVYYAGIPAKNKNKEKEQVLQYFHKGVPHNQSKEVRDFDWQPVDLAVIQGWVHENSSKSPHLNFRRQVIDNQARIGKHVLAIDSNLFLYRDPGNTKQYLRYSLDGVFPTTGNYFGSEVDPRRWQQIKKDLGVEIQPWRDRGKNILIALQRNGGWSMGNYDSITWCRNTIAELRKYTNRPIIIRPHPGDKKTRTLLKGMNLGVKISNNESLLADFKNCWAVVTYNSSPGVAAAIEGIPVFVTDLEPRKSQAYQVCNTNLQDIENPACPERQNWIERISMSHYNFRDLQNGTAWSVISKYI